MLREKERTGGGEGTGPGGGGCGRAHGEGLAGSGPHAEASSSAGAGGSSRAGSYQTSTQRCRKSKSHGRLTGDETTSVRHEHAQTCRHRGGLRSRLPPEAPSMGTGGCGPGVGAQYHSSNDRHVAIIFGPIRGKFFRLGGHPPHIPDWTGDPTDKQNRFGWNRHGENVGKGWFEILGQTGVPPVTYPYLAGMALGWAGQK